MKKLLLLIASASFYSANAMDQFPWNQDFESKADDCLRLCFKMQKPLSKKIQKWFKFVRSCNTEKMYAMLQQGFNVNTTDQMGATALHVATTEADTADTAMVSLLLSNNANPNAQDQNGETPLYHALSALNKRLTDLEKIIDIINITLAQIEHEYILLSEKKLEDSNGRVNQYAIDARDQKLALIRTRYNKVVEKAEPTIARAEAQVRSYANTAALLINYGASGKIHTKKNQTIAQHWKGLFESIQIPMLIQAIKSDNHGLVSHCLNEGIDARCITEQEIPLLVLATGHNAQKSARLLLYHGAQLATPFPCSSEGHITVLHQAADTKNAELIKVFLESPQGGPSSCSNKHDLKKIQQEILAFLCCVNRESESTSINSLNQGVIKHNICKFLVPDLATLIDEVSLQQLPKFMDLRVWLRFFDKAAVIKALTERHIELVNNVLETKAGLPTPRDLLPHQIARLNQAADGNVYIAEQPTDTSKLLDPAENPLEKRREAIEANYRKLLE